MSDTTKTEARYLAELAIAYLALGLQMVAQNRFDLAAYFLVKSAEKATEAKEKQNAERIQ